MRYNICGFDQSIATRLGLDGHDLILLRWFVDFSVTGKMVRKIVDNEVYYWIKYDYIIEQLPVLDIQKQAVYRRLQKMVDCGILIHHTEKVDGTFSMYGFGKMMAEIIYEDKEGVSQTTEGYVVDDRGGMSQTTDQIFFYKKNSSVKNNARQARKQCKEDSKKTYGSFDNVRLTDEEHSKLVERFGLSGAKDRIENLSLYIKSKNAKYADHNATILAWERKKEEKVPLKEEKEKAGCSDGYKFV